MGHKDKEQKNQINNGKVDKGQLKKDQPQTEQQKFIQFFSNSYRTQNAVLHSEHKKALEKFQCVFIKNTNATVFIPVMNQFHEWEVYFELRHISDLTGFSQFDLATGNVTQDDYNISQDYYNDYYSNMIGNGQIVDTKHNGKKRYLSFDYILEYVHQNGHLYDIIIDVHSKPFGFIPQDKMVFPHTKHFLIVGAAYDEKDMPYLVIANRQDTSKNINTMTIPYHEYIKLKIHHNDYINNPAPYLVGPYAHQTLIKNISETKKISVEEAEKLINKKLNFSNNDYTDLFSAVPMIAGMVPEGLVEMLLDDDKRQFIDKAYELSGQFVKAFGKDVMTEVYQSINRSNLLHINQVYLPKNDHINLVDNSIVHIHNSRHNISNKLEEAAEKNDDIKTKLDKFQTKLKTLLIYHQNINWLDNQFQLQKEKRIWTELRKAYKEVKDLYVNYEFEEFLKGYITRSDLSDKQVTDAHKEEIRRVYNDAKEAVIKEIELDAVYLNENYERITNQSFHLIFRQFMAVLNGYPFTKTCQKHFDMLIDISKNIASRPEETKKSVHSRTNNDPRLYHYFILDSEKKENYKKFYNQQEAEKIVENITRHKKETLPAADLINPLPADGNRNITSVLHDIQYNQLTGEYHAHLKARAAEENRQAELESQYNEDEHDGYDVGEHNNRNDDYGSYDDHEVDEYDGYNSYGSYDEGDYDDHHDDYDDYNSYDGRNSEGPKNSQNKNIETKDNKLTSEEVKTLEDFSVKRTQGTADQLKETISQLCSYYHITEGELRQLLDFIKVNEQILDNNSIKEFIKEIKRSNGIEAPEKRSINFDIDRSILTLSQIKKISAFISIKSASQKLQNRQAEIVPFRVIQKNNPLEQTLFMKKVAGGEGMFISPSSKIDSSQQFIPPTGGGGGSSGGGGGKPPTIKLKLIKPANRMNRVTSYGKELSFMLFPFAAEMGSKYVGSYFTDNPRTIEAIGDSSWGVSIPLYYVANAYRSNPLATKAALGNYAKLAGQIGRSSGIVALKTIPTAAEASPKIMVVAVPFILTKLLIEAPKRSANSSDEVMCLYQYGALNFRQTSYYLNPDYQGKAFIPDRVESKRLQTGHNHSFTLSGEVYYINQSMINRLRDPIFQLNQYKNYSVSMDSNVKSPTLNQNKNKTDVKKLTTVSK